MIRTNIYLSEKQMGRLRDISEDTGIRIAEIVRRAVDAYLEAKYPANSSVKRGSRRKE